MELKYYETKNPIKLTGLMQCGRRDSNPHAVKRQILSLVRLPITPLPQLGFLRVAKID